MTINKLAKKLGYDPKTIEEKASMLFVVQSLRSVESELWEIGSKFGVKTVEELDQKIASGKITESQGMEDLYRFDFLVEKKKELEMIFKESMEKSQNRLNLWESIKSSTASPQWNLGI